MLDGWNSGENVIHGGAGDDRALGGAGRDTLSGGVDDNEFFGGSGNDFIDGGLGEDMLYRGDGDDVFILGLHDNAIDTVFDYEGINRLQVEGGGGKTVQAYLLGDDLAVLADGEILFTVQDFASNEASFDGVKAVNRYIQTENHFA